MNGNFILNNEITPKIKSTVKATIVTLSSVDGMHFGFGTRGVFGTANNGQAEIIIYRTNGTVH